MSEKYLDIDAHADGCNGENAAAVFRSIAQTIEEAPGRKRYAFDVEVHEYE